MAYQIRVEERIPDAIERIMLEQLERASQQLADQKRPEAERIHDARKRFKEIRALLRLVRKPLGSSFAPENAWFRDTGRDLAPLREAQALVEALEKLEEHFNSWAERKAFKRARRIFTRRRNLAHAANLDESIAAVARQLPLARERVGTWTLTADGFEAIEGGLRRTYRGGRRAFRAAMKNPSAVNFHEWRKRVKDHWYHTQLLRDLWAPLEPGYSEVMKRLSDVLGDHHDLSALFDMIWAEPKRFGEMRGTALLLTVIAERSAELEEMAAAIGNRVYAASSRDFRARMESAWNAWHGAGDQNQGQPEQEVQTPS